MPNGTKEVPVEALRRHFSDQNIVEIVSVISLFGFLNRWNDTLATTLEPGAQDLASQTLRSAGWQKGKHGSI